MRRAAGKAREEAVAVATGDERIAVGGDASASRRRDQSWVTLLVEHAVVHRLHDEERLAMAEGRLVHQTHQTLETRIVAAIAVLA